MAHMAIQSEEIDSSRVAEPINRAYCKRMLIQQARDTRYYWMSVDNIRVSKETLDRLAAGVSASIRSIVEKLPSKGKTI